MKRVVIAVSVVVLGIIFLFVGTSTAIGAKGGSKGADLGLDFLLHGNGYPSGPHFNLNVHGKGETFTCETVEEGIRSSSQSTANQHWNSSATRNRP